MTPEKTPYPKEVRLATMRDAASLLELMRKAHEEQPIAPFCDASVQRTISAAIQSTSGKKGIIGVIDGKNGIEGYILAFITPWWFSDEAKPSGWRLEELTNFVHPDHRQGAHAKHLIQFAKWAAENINLILIMGIMTNGRLSSKIRLYERQVTPFGGLFFHNATEGSLAEMG